MLHAFLDSLVRVNVRRTSVRLKYYPQHPVPELPQIITLCCVTDQISQPYNLSCKNILPRSFRYFLRSSADFC